MKIHPTKEKLLELFDYNPNDGSFKRLVTVSPNGMVGKVIFGTKLASGYLHIQVDGKLFLVHRLAWIISNGNIQDNLNIDHINRNRSDNRLSNLRLVTSSENHHNRKPNLVTASNIQGVYWDSANKKWRAHIYLNKKEISLGYFDNLDNARIARENAKLTYHPSSPLFFSDKLNLTKG